MITDMRLFYSDGKGRTTLTLWGVSFTIAGGTQVGIIGRTGAGKSSILNALFRLYPTGGGSIMVDGVSIAGVSVKYLRSSFAVVPQAPLLFEGSISPRLLAKACYCINDELVGRQSKSTGAKPCIGLDFAEFSREVIISSSFSSSLGSGSIPWFLLSALIQSLRQTRTFIALFRNECRLSPSCCRP
ncbi:hypothetical protein BC332_31931 [Capsicum chinense]|nr:hypothetical protein BC332_31931 [Capsicum chinense]